MALFWLHDDFGGSPATYYCHVGELVAGHLHHERDRRAQLGSRRVHAGEV